VRKVKRAKKAAVHAKKAVLKAEKKEVIVKKPCNKATQK
jgi:hypothetical protein